MMNKQENKLRPTRQQAEDAVKVILEYLGEDVGRCGVLKTPERVVKFWGESVGSYGLPEPEMSVFLNDHKCDMPIKICGIKFISYCEHHLLKFRGTVEIVYTPSDYIAGFGSFVRIIRYYAGFLQTQENFTNKIIEKIKRDLKPKTLEVKTIAKHDCVGLLQPEQENVVVEVVGC